MGPPEEPLLLAASAEAEGNGGFPLPPLGPGARVFVPLPPSRAERSLGALPLSVVVGRVPQELGDARPVTMATAAPGKSEVGGVEGPLPHADAAWRGGLLGRLPTHPALSLDLRLYKGRTIPQGSLKGRR